MWILFILFVLLSIIFNYQEITYDNFFYLMRDFSSAVDAETTTHETISYEASPGQHFALYRGGVAVVSPSGISAFTATGRRTLQAESDFSAPFVVCSDQYMLVYDTAGKTFSVYNSFAKVYTETLTYPVVGASFASDGSFALITREADRRAVVHIYDKDFRRQAVSLQQHRMQAMPTSCSLSYRQATRRSTTFTTATSSIILDLSVQTRHSRLLQRTRPQPASGR